MTAQESFRAYQAEKDRQRNRQKYHTDSIRQYNGQTVAESGNWLYRLVIYSDESAAVLYIAKPGSGCGSGHYCGTATLKNHLKSVGLERWTITEPGFFEALEIRKEATA